MTSRLSVPPDCWTVVVVGAGRIGTEHAKNLAALGSPAPGRSVYVRDLILVDERLEAASALAREIGATTLPLENFWNAAVPGNWADVVVFCTPTSTHAGYIRRAAEAGVRTVFCEKPIALDVRDTQEALKAVERAGTKLMIGFQRRFDPGTRYAARHLQELVGNLRKIHMEANDREPPPAEYLRGSGGMPVDMLIHCFDEVRFVTGEEVVVVRARGWNYNADPCFEECGDYADMEVELELTSGRVVTINGSRYNSAGYDMHFVMRGTKGVWAVGLDDRTPLRSVEAGVAWPAGKPYEGFLDRYGPAYAAEMLGLIEYAVSEPGTPSPSSGHDALQALRIALACRLSAREGGRPVRLSEIAGG
jgi:myo-inositol 2-dehydrogenase / D-chiro-inositol 1-dehydrogenase